MIEDEDMKLILNICDEYDYYAPAEFAKIVKQAGFDGADMGLFRMKNQEHPWNGANWLEHAENLKSAYLDAGVPFVQTHAPFNFKQMDDHGFVADVYYPTMIRSIEFSAALGAQYVIVHPMHHIPYYENRQELFEMNMEQYRKLIPVAKSNGIKIAVENMFQRDKLRGGHVVDSTCSRPEEFCRYVDTLDSDYIVACLDIGHTTLISGNASPDEYIRILGHERLKTLHVHDNDYKSDRHVIPFSGLIDWYQVTKALGEINYTGDMVYECLIDRVANKMDPSQYPAVLEYMAKIGKHLIEQVEMNRKSI